MHKIYLSPPGKRGRGVVYFEGLHIQRYLTNGFDRRVQKIKNSPFFTDFEEEKGYEPELRLKIAEYIS